jgi:hypothetical protein
MNLKIFYLFFYLLIAITCFSGQIFAQKDSCLVTLNDPARDGVEVKKGMTVKGYANIPSGYHLWVLVRRIDFEDVWWPQNEGKIDPKTHEWKVFVTFGQSEDIGWDFCIAALVIKEDDHIKLKDYRKKAMKDGDFRPIEAPSSLCPPQIRMVKKNGHN